MNEEFKDPELKAWEPREVTCPHCGYSWESRKEKPKKCPLCIKWINKPKPIKA
jgi:rubrerythrin